MAMGDGPYMKGGSYRYVIAAAEASLKRLGTDYIDLYQIHQPDPETPQHETLEALNDLVRAGKVRYIGHSNFAAWQTVDAHWISRTRGLASYISAQNQYNLLDRRIERELIPACREFGVGILPYFPLASGFLTGKYKRGAEPPKGTRLAMVQRMAKQALTDENFATLEKLEKFAQQPRAYDARAGGRMARVTAASLERNLGRNERRSGNPERKSRQLEIDAGRTRRSR